MTLVVLGRGLRLRLEDLDGLLREPSESITDHIGGGHPSILLSDDCCLLYQVGWKLDGLELGHDSYMNHVCIIMFASRMNHRLSITHNAWITHM
jgi:hypothetical protein